MCVCCCAKPKGLCGQDACTSSLLDLLLSQLGEELCLDDHRLVGELSLTQHLEDPVLGHVNHGGGAAVLGSGLTCLRDMEGNVKEGLEQSFQAVWFGLVGVLVMKVQPGMLCSTKLVMGHWNSWNCVGHKTFNCRILVWLVGQEGGGGCSPSRY